MIVSTSAVGIPLQSLVGLGPGWIVPVQLTVRACPVLVGMVTDWGDGDAARAPVVGTTRAARVSTAVTTAERRMAHSSTRPPEWTARFPSP